MALNTQATIDALMSHAQALGLFEQFVGHEPISALGNGLTGGTWVSEIQPYAKASGLARTAAVSVYAVRLYTPAAQQPLDAIDPALTNATDLLMEAYSGDFDLGGNVRNIDLLGESGYRLLAKAGWQTLGDITMRIMNITVPVIINDAFTQAS
jgi:hypothetical protein